MHTLLKTWAIMDPVYCGRNVENITQRLITRNQIAFSHFGDLISRSRSPEWNMLLYSYDPVADVPSARTDEEAAEIVGSPTPSLNGMIDREIHCPICLEPFGNTNEEIKELPCNHIFHYQCILISTQFKNHCPVCPQEYDSRYGQSNEVG